MPILLERPSRHGKLDASAKHSSPSTASMMLYALFRGSRRVESTREPSAALPAANELPPSYVECCSPGPGSSSSVSSSLPSYAPRGDDTNTNAATAHITTAGDDPFSFLSTFDTVFLVDDSGSMAGRSWRDTSAALAAIVPICTAHDSDGIDLHFLNHRFASSEQHTHLTTPAAVAAAFAAVRPYGGTPTGTRLASLLGPYLSRCAAHGCAAVRPLSIIVVTDGAAADDVESVLVAAARRLDNMGAPAWQVGVQFVQVGREAGAAEALRELDDGLAEVGGVRDMVDTVPWCDGGGDGGLTVERLIKVVLGAVVRRLDRRRASGEGER